MMFENFFSFTPTVTESGSYYIISGIKCKYFGDDLKRVYGTSVIASRVIKQLSSNRMRIHRFFMLELACILDDLVNKQVASKQRGFRVNVNLYRLLYEQVKENTWIKSTLLDYDPYELRSILAGFKFTPFPDQHAFLEQYRSIKYGFQLKGCLLDAAPGSGKALWDEDTVLTPTGFTKMKKIKVGDKVIGSNGEPVTVTGVYPQGIKQLYEVVFEDERKVVCCGEHLWNVFNGKKQVTKDTETLLKELEANPNSLCIPLMKGEYNQVTKNKGFALTPYAVGVILGCARPSANVIKFSIVDRYVAAQVKKDIATLGYRLRKRDAKHYIVTEFSEEVKPFTQYIEDMNIRFSGCLRKTIPNPYMYTDYQSRLSLIQGLMDINGEVQNSTKIIFETINKTLSKQLQMLIRSIGGVATLTHRIPSYFVDEVLKRGKLIYRVTIKINDPKRLFRHSSQKGELAEVKHVRGIAIKSITPVFSDKATCIKVDAPDHLFVCGDYTVTHNTYTSLVWSRMVSKGKKIILVPKHLIGDPWIDHLDPSGKQYCFNKPPKYWVSTSKTDPRKEDAEFFIFYKEQMRKDTWEGIPFTSLLKDLSNSGSIPLSMIIDESHNYNEISAQQTQGMVEFASNQLIGDVLFMSGTPIKSAGKETYPLFSVIDPLFDKHVREPFLKLYSRNNTFLNEMLAHRLGRIKFTISTIRGMEEPPEPIPIPVKFAGSERFTLDNIRAEMLSYIQERITFYRKMMPRYIEDLNAYLDEYRYITSNDKEEQALIVRYRKIVEYFRRNGFDTLRDGENSRFCKQMEKKIEVVLNLRGDELKYFRFILPAVKYVALKVKGEALGNVLGKARIEVIKACIEHLDIVRLVKTGKKKTAIYSTYIDAIDYTYKKLVAGGCKPVRLHSGDKGSITEALTKLNGTQADSIVTSFETLSEGVPLLMCNQLLLLNLPWREFQLRQTIARIYRNGQDTDCFVWAIELDTDGKENINTRTRDIMEYFAEQVDTILGNGKIDVGGGVLKLTDHSPPPEFSALTPFDVSVPAFRPKFKDRSFINIFR